MMRILIVVIAVCLSPVISESKTYTVGQAESKKAEFTSVTQALQAAIGAGDTDIVIRILEGGPYKEVFPWHIGSTTEVASTSQGTSAPINITIESIPGVTPFLQSQNSTPAKPPILGTNSVNLTLRGSEASQRMTFMNNLSNTILCIGSKAPFTGNLKIENVVMEGSEQSPDPLIEILSPCSAEIKDCSFLVHGSGACIHLADSAKSTTTTTQIALDKTILDSGSGKTKVSSEKDQPNQCGLLAEAPVNFSIRNGSVIRHHANSGIRVSSGSSTVPSNVYIMDSTIDSIGGYGVFLDSGSSLNIEHSKILQCGLSAITRSAEGLVEGKESGQGPGKTSILKQTLIDTGAPHALEFRIPCDVLIEETTLKGYSDWGLTIECAKGVGKRECVIRNTVFDQRGQTDRAVAILVSKGTMDDGYSFDLSDCSFLAGGAGIVIQSASQSLKAERCVFDQLSGSAINTLENGARFRLTVDHCDFYKCLVGIFFNKSENNALVSFTNFVDCGFIEANGFSRGGTIFHDGVGVVTDKNNVFASRFRGGGLAPTPEGLLEMDPNSVQTDDVDQYLSVEFGNANYMRLRPGTPGSSFVDSQGEMVHSGSKIPGDIISRNFILY